MLNIPVMTPLVSVIVPCYNQAKYLDETLQSILDQTYSNWECIIVNDGSTDNTAAIAQKWINKDNRFTYYFQENTGVSSARNLGIQCVKGDFVQFLDSDDILDRNKIEVSINTLSTSQCNVAITNFKTFSVDKNQAVEHPGFLNSDFLNFKGILYEWGYYFNIPIHCGLFPSSFFQTFRFSTELKGNEDWIMWVSFFLKDPSVSFIDKVMAFYRSHKDGVTKNEAVMNDSYLKAIEYLRSILSNEEYINFLFFLVSKKENTIIQLQQKVQSYQNSTTSKILKRIMLNPVGKIGAKYILKLIKK